MCRGGEENRDGKDSLLLAAVNGSVLETGRWKFGSQERDYRAEAARPVETALPMLNDRQAEDEAEAEHDAPVLSLSLMTGCNFTRVCRQSFASVSSRNQSNR